MRQALTPPVRILQIEDDPLDVELTLHTLRDEGINAEIDRVETIEAVIEALERGGYDLVLSDYSLPGMDPMEALRRSRELRPELPFIILSGTLGEELAIETLKSGATDYVLKQRLVRVVPAVRRALAEAGEQAARRKAEDALRETEERRRTELERAVREAVAEVRKGEEERERLRQQLHQSQKMDAIGRLAGGVAHDFNNLMTVVGGYSERLLRRLPAQSPLRDEVRQIKLAGERAAALTGQLLAFSRKQVLSPEILNLDGALNEMLRMLARLLGDDVSLIQTCALKPQWVRVDKNQFEQVVMNLAVNSRDAMPRGGTLTLAMGEAVLGEAEAARLEVVPGAYSTLTVADTGSGMSPEVLDHVFEPFFTTKLPGQGTGLGLATVHGIVKQSGGGIEVESEPGRGTRFAIYLPQLEAPQDQLCTVAPAVPAATRESGTLLLVEDEESILTLLAEDLEEIGYRVLTAQNCAQAEGFMAEAADEIDLLVTDVVLAESSGPEVYRSLRRRKPELKVLYMSGHDRGHVIQRGILDSDTAFVKKPFTTEELAARIKELLGD